MYVLLLYDVTLGIITQELDTEDVAIEASLTLAEKERSLPGFSDA